MGKYIEAIDWSQFLINDCSNLGFSAQRYCYTDNYYAIVCWMIAGAIISTIAIKLFFHIKFAKGRLDEK